MRIVGVDHVGPPLMDDAGQLPCGGQVDLTARYQADQVGSFRRTAIELALAVRHEHGPVPQGAKPQNRQEDLVLAAAPGAGRVDVEGEDSSHSFANFRAT